MANWNVSVVDKNRTVSLMVSSDDGSMIQIFNVKPEAALELSVAFKKAHEATTSMIINPDVTQRKQ